jgi:DNA-binding FadR family transcriptional regulator
MVIQGTRIATFDGQQDAATAVTRAAAALRDEILLIAEEGVFLGSEEELLRRLAVSRTTFRQAIRILEYEELVTIRRGVGGGFFTRSPTASSIARMAAVYMSFRRTPHAQVLQASSVLRREAVRLIATATDPEVRRGPLEFVVANSGFYAWPDRRQAIRVVTRFHQLVAQLSGNAALELFMDVVKMFGNRSDQMIFTADRLREYEQIIRGQAEAIAAGEVAKALALTDREVETALQWLESPRK